MLLSSIHININAETTAGGIAHLIISQVAEALRANTAHWIAAYEPYVLGIIDVVVPKKLPKASQFFVRIVSSRFFKRYSLTVRVVVVVQIIEESWPYVCAAARFNLHG